MLVKENEKKVIFAAIIAVVVLASLQGALVIKDYAASSYAYSLTVNSSHGATYGSGTYSNGTTATFGVSPTIVYDSLDTARYVFAGWSCSGSGCYSGTSSSASVVMNDNIVETANWITQYLLSTSITGNGSVNPSGQDWYDAGSSVQVTETAQGAGWFFAYWNLDGTNVGSSQTYTVVMNSPHNLVANFIKPELESKLVNVTDSYGNNLRNPDGTFYRLDEFKILYDVVIVGGDPLPPSVSFIVNITYPQSALSESANGSGYATFIVLPGASFAPYNITLTASIFNSVDNSNRLLPIYSSEPFAVISYSPHFAYYTYMDYNTLNSSAYERPFITLLRYDGNSPGYSYSGDINTDPFNALNSTGERAIVDNFTFSTEGWSISANLSQVNDSMSVIDFVQHPNLSLSVTSMNETTSPYVITWANRVEKFYFLSNIQEIRNYVNTDSIIYFNVTVQSSYVNSYESVKYKMSNFNTSYLYQPVFYNGYLIFEPYGGSDANFSVSITSNNPSPLDPYLISQASTIFGNDSAVLSALEQDLYPANSTTVLKPVISNSQEWVFLMNQTNIALPSQDQMPYYTISVTGNSGYTEYSYDPSNPPYYLSPPTTYYNQNSENITYYAYDYFSLFVMSDFPSSTAFPFDNITGYYVMQPSVGQDLVMQPLNFSFTSPMPYLIRTYGNSTDPFFVSYEPGNITQSFPMIYGENQTTIISPDFAGGGLVGLDGNPVSLDGGTTYQVSLLIGNQSGGASQVWVVSDNGEVLYNESLPISSLSTSLLSPSGYVGDYMFQFSVGNTNHSVTIYVENAWGGISIIEGVSVSPESPPSLYYSPMFLSFILVVAFAISAGIAVFARANMKD
jgi:hypothetical protein